MLGEADEAMEEIQGYAFGGPTGLPPQMMRKMGPSRVLEDAEPAAVSTGDGAAQPADLA